MVQDITLTSSGALITADDDIAASFGSASIESKAQQQQSSGDISRYINNKFGCFLKNDNPETGIGPRRSDRPQAPLLFFPLRITEFENSFTPWIQFLGSV